MGSALLDVWYRKIPFKISVIDPKTHKILKKKYTKKVLIYKSIEEINDIKQFNAIILAVKPQIAKKAVSQFYLINNKKVLFLSIIAGTKIDFFATTLLHPNQIIRALPNLPAFV